MKSAMPQSNQTACGEFARGYFCAVAALLAMDGGVSTEVRELFSMGGDPAQADAIDIEKFRAVGLMK